jgi:hypothetical protein
MRTNKAEIVEVRFLLHPTPDDTCDDARHESDGCEFFQD